MALDLEVVVRDREFGTETERFVQLSLTPRELGIVHKAILAIKSGFDIDFHIELD